MNPPVSFEEEQIFEAYTFIVPIAIVSLLPVTILIAIENLFAGLAIGIGLFSIVLTILNLIKLFLKIDNTGINYKFRPFHWSFNPIQWRNIKNISIIDLKSLKDFSGFGISYVGKKKGIILAGKSALEIEDINGKTTVISLKNKEAVQKIITIYHKRKENL